MNVGSITMGRIGKVHAKNSFRFSPAPTVKSMEDSFLNREAELFCKKLGR